MYNSVIAKEGFEVQLFRDICSYYYGKYKTILVLRRKIFNQLKVLIYFYEYLND